MPGQLDEISFKIGELSEKLRSLDLDITQDRAVLAQHMAALDVRFAKVDKTLDMIEPLAETVKEMKPHVEDYKTMRAKLAVVALIVGGAIALLWQALFALGPEIKSLVMRLLKS